MLPEPYTSRSQSEQEEETGSGGDHSLLGLQPAIFAGNTVFLLCFLICLSERIAEKTTNERLDNCSGDIIDGLHSFSLAAQGIQLARDQASANSKQQQKRAADDQFDSWPIRILRLSFENCGAGILNRLHREMCRRFRGRVRPGRRRVRGAFGSFPAPRCRFFCVRRFLA